MCSFGSVLALFSDTYDSLKIIGNSSSSIVIEKGNTRVVALLTGGREGLVGPLFAWETETTSLEIWTIISIASASSTGASTSTFVLGIALQCLIASLTMETINYVNFPKR